MMRMKKLISLILTLVMMLSLLPMAALADAGAISAVNDEELAIPDMEVRDFDPEDYTDEDEFPVPDMEERDFDPTLTEAEGEEESLFLFAEPDEETFVSVEAPYGALPALAELKAERVDVEDIREAVEAKMNGEQNILLALDISFWLDGVEIEPAEEVQVRISAPELEGEGALTLVHVPEEAEVETVALIPEEELGFELEVNEIAFESKDFSVYAVLGATPTPVPVGDPNDVAPHVTYELRWINAEDNSYSYADDGHTLICNPVNDGNDSGGTFRLAKMQIYFKFNAAETEQLPVGSVSFKIPKYIFQNWQSTSDEDRNAVTVNTDGVLKPPIMWQVPEAPAVADSSSFNYVEDGDYYILSNFEPIQGDRSLIVDIGYEYRPVDVKVQKDGQDGRGIYTNDSIQVAMSVDSPDHSIHIAEETQELALEFHSHINNGSISKSQSGANGTNSDKFLSWQSTWGPKPSDADDYFYIYWTILVSRADGSTMPYDMLLKELDAVIDLGTNGTINVPASESVVGITYHSNFNSNDEVGFFSNYTVAPQAGIAGKDLSRRPVTRVPFVGMGTNARSSYINGTGYGVATWGVLTRYKKDLLTQAQEGGVNLVDTGLKITNRAQMRYIPAYDTDPDSEGYVVSSSQATTYFRLDPDGGEGTFIKYNNRGTSGFMQVGSAHEYILDLDKSRMLFTDYLQNRTFYINATFRPLSQPTPGEDGHADILPYTYTITDGDLWLTPVTDNTISQGTGDCRNWNGCVPLDVGDYSIQTISLSLTTYEGVYVDVGGEAMYAKGDVIPAEDVSLELWVLRAAGGDYELYGTIQKNSSGTFDFTRAAGFEGGVASKTGIKIGTGYGSSVWLTMPEHTAKIKLVHTTTAYEGSLRLDMRFSLDPSDTTREVLQNCRDQQLAAVLTNHSFYKVEDTNSSREGQIPTYQGNDRYQSVWLAPLTGTITASKTTRASSGLVDDVVNTTQYYTVACRLEVNGANSGGDLDLMNMFVPHTGVWYDLLPEGCTVDESTVKIEHEWRNTYFYGGTNPADMTVTVMHKWNGTERDLLIVEMRNMRSWYYDNGDEGGWILSFRMHNSYVNIVDRGTDVVNVFGFICTDEGATMFRPNSNAKIGKLTTEQDIMRQVMAEMGWDDDYINRHGCFAQNTYIYKNVGIVETGFSKTVATTINTNYTKENESFVGQNYSYRLSYVQKEDTVSNNIVIFDVIEQGSDLTDQETEWQGKFVGLDISLIDDKPNNNDKDTTCAPVVYYATTIPDAEHLTYTALDAAANGDTSVWSPVLPDDPSAVKAFIVDCRKDEKGNDFYLLAGETLNMYFHMVAPNDVSLAGKYAVNGATLISDLNSMTGGVTPEVPSEAYSTLLLLDPHLQLHKTSDPETGTAEAPTTVEVGSTLTYTLAVSVDDEDNGAKYDLTNIKVEDPIPDGLTIDFAGIRYYTSSNSALQTLGSGKRAQVRQDGQTLYFTITTLAKGETIHLVIPTTVDALEESTDLVVYVNQAKLTAYNNYPADPVIESEITYHQAWQVFYVYHSGHNNGGVIVDLPVERIRLCDERVTRRADGTLSFDIVAETLPDFMYGGYYSKYNRTSPDYDSTKLSFSNKNWSADRGGRPYVGGLGYWSGAKAYTQNGHDMTPKGGETYYLKEVPYWFLQPYLYVIYDMYAGTDGNGPVVDMYMLGNVDDNNYQTIGLFATDIETGERIKMAVSFTITDTVHGRTDKIDATVVAGASFPGISDVRGYVTVWHPGVQETEHEFVYTPYYVTPDGVTVEGCFTRTANTGDGWYYEDDTGTFLEPGIHFTKALNELIKQPGNESTRPPQN